MYILFFFKPILILIKFCIFIEVITDTKFGNDIIVEGTINFEGVFRLPSK